MVPMEKINCKLIFLYWSDLVHILIFMCFPLVFPIDFQADVKCFSYWFLLASSIENLQFCGFRKGPFVSHPQPCPKAVQLPWQKVACKGLFIVTSCVPWQKVLCSILSWQKGGLRMSGKGGHKHFAKPYVDPYLLYKAFHTHEELLKSFGAYETVSRIRGVSMKIFVSPAAFFFPMANSHCPKDRSDT